MRSQRGWIGVFAILAATAVRPMSAQDIASETERNAAADARALDALLSRPVTITIDNVSLTRALKALASSAGVSVQYNAEIVEQYTHPITLHARAVTLGAALETVLAGTKLKVVPLSTTSFAVVPSSVTSAAVVGVLTGTVRDGKTQQPLPNATVVLDDSVARAQTDRNGRYRFANISAGAHRLTVRIVGFARQTRLVTAVDDQSTVTDFTLTASVNTLTEVVTTATGQKQRMEVGNDIGVIKADSLVATQQIRTVSDLLQGRLPGVFVANVDGAVGAPSRIRLRGANSISLNNDPIVIVDGIRINAQTTQALLQTNTGSIQMLQQVTGNQSTYGQGPQPPAAPSRLDDLDPNTIEKVEVLYGPSASSLYGTDAANGVIVITTKRGHPGSLRATLTADAGQSYMPGSSPEMWWGWGRFGAWSGAGYTASCNLAVSASFGGGSLANGSCVQDSVTQYNPQNDPNMRTLGTGTSQSVNATVSGGTDQVQQFLSGSTQSDVGMAQMSPAQERVIGRLYNETLPSWMKRPNTQQEVNGLSRTTVTLGTAADVSLSASGTYRNVLNGGNGLQSFMTSGVVTGAQTSDTLTYLPSESQRTRVTSAAKRGVAGLDGNYRPWSWLRISGQAGGDYTLRSDEALLRRQDCSSALQTYDVGYVAGCPSLHSFANTETFVTTVNGAAAATYVPFSWLTLTTTVGEQYTHTNNNFLQVGNADPYGCPLAFGTTLLSPGPVCSNSTAQQYAVNNSADASASAGVYAEETINVFGLYYTLGIRRDVASGFGRQTVKQPPQYPKFNLSIPISDKDFFPKQSLVSLLRLRVAYGQSGNQASQTAVLNNYQGSVFVTGVGSVNTITITQLGNQSLRPEKSAEWEGGVDVSFLDNERIGTKLTMSRKFTRDLITPFSLPDSYGFTGANANSQYYQNVGDVVSHSLEFSLDARVIDRRSLTWNVSVGMTKSDNKLVRKSPTLLFYGNSTGSQYREGYPLNGYWGAPVVSYTDVNHDGFLEQDEVTFGPLSYFGAPYPTSMLNYSSDLSLWNGALRFSATLNQVNGQVNALCVDASCGVYPRAAVDPSTPMAQQAAYIQSMVNNAQYIASSSSVRLNEASMTYTVPVRLARRFARAQSLSFTLSGRNLALWTNYAGQDPNVNTAGLFGELTMDSGLGTPQPRSWIVRCNLGF